MGMVIMMIGSLIVAVPRTTGASIAREVLMADHGHGPIRDVMNCRFVSFCGLNGGLTDC